jgi:hypothetical protein
MFRKTTGQADIFLSKLLPRVGKKVTVCLESHCGLIKGFLQLKEPQ